MSSRTIEYPGIELNEIDRSGYEKEDYSLPNASICFVAGFADQGQEYEINWINTIETFKEKFGIPTNEYESYLYNAAYEILNRNGVCLAVRLPYKNESTDQYNFVEYKVNGDNQKPNNPIEIDNDSNYSSLLSADSFLTSYLNLNITNYGKSDLSVLDNYMTNSNNGAKPNTIRIYDITRQQYKRFDNYDGCVKTNMQIDSDEIRKNTNDCLGIVPVLITPANALFFQNSISVDTLSAAYYNQIGYFKSLDVSDILLSFDDLMQHTMLPLSSLSTEYSNGYDQPSLSQKASLGFPLINYNSYNHFDTKWLKCIGVAVFMAYADQENDGKLNFQLLESFVGSLDKTAKDPVTNENMFIDSIVNSQSQFIRLFSNVNRKFLESASTLAMSQTSAISLGFYKKQCEKNISYVDSIMNPLTRVLDNAGNKNTLPLDIVVDAGMSNIARVAKNAQTINADIYPNMADLSVNWRTSDNIDGWSTLLKKFDTFTKYTRKDCLFLADGLRDFCLDGNSKIVRSTNYANTVTNSIIPKLQKMVGVLNSSYSAGYCNWYYQQDYSGFNNYFWCPPSIKTSGVCILCDTYFHPWSAPAGQVRGVLNDVIDTAFTPQEADAGKIYSNQWNYAMNYPIDGIVIEGQKTFQTNKTALDRINVRRLMLYLQKRVIRIARKFVYEQNTEYTRQLFVDTIRPIFEDAVNGSGIRDYAIKCDDEINTPEVIENNEMRCRIAVRPVKTLEYLVLDFIVSRQTANVNEEVLR